MKTVLTAAILTLATAFPLAGLAADQHAGHGAMHGAAPAAAAPASAALADGVVKKVDKPGGKVTIAHGPLANIAMPPMTMAFRVKDAAWLNQLKEGDKIRFMADNVNGALTVVQLEAAK